MARIDKRIIDIIAELSDDETTIEDNVKALRKSNMIRHHIVNTPLMNYSKECLDNPCSFIEPRMISDK